MAHPANEALFNTAVNSSLQVIAKYEGLFANKAGIKNPVQGKHDISANAPDNTKLYAYLDSVDIPTIGWGTTHYPNGVAVKMGDTCTKAQADQWRIWEAKQKCKQLLPMIDVPVSLNFLTALVSATFNTGAGGRYFDKKKGRYVETGFYGSSLRKIVNRGGDAQAIATALMSHIMTAGGVVNKGLVRRRLGEARFSLGLTDWYLEVDSPIFKSRWAAVSGKKK